MTCQDSSSKFTLLPSHMSLSLLNEIQKLPEAQIRKPRIRNRNIPRTPPNPPHRHSRCPSRPYNRPAHLWAKSRWHDMSIQDLLIIVIRPRVPRKRAFGLRVRFHDLVPWRRGMDLSFAADVPYFWHEERVAWSRPVVRFEELDERYCWVTVGGHGIIFFRAMG